MKKVAAFAETHGFKVFGSTSLTTISKGDAKFRISRQAGSKYKLSESKNNRIQIESTYHSSEDEVIVQIEKMLSEQKL